jgi:ATP-dependent helicase HrpB
LGSNTPSADDGGVRALPIDPYLPQIVEHVRRSRALVVVAAPGAGKTTRVAPALSADGPVLLLQPRRIAARTIARRIADEQEWTIGDEVGWQVRLERRYGPRTRVLLATEGILTGRLQQDPLLTDFKTIILDEFHERSIHADLGIALGRQAWLARDDLRLVVMSATIDATSVGRFLDDAPIVEIPGRLHPLALRYLPGATMADAVRDAANTPARRILCFLPGAPEIRRALPDVQAVVARDIDVVPLYGTMDADAQDAALAEGGRRRIILATNIAETSLTVPGVSAVVDSGLHKVARYDPDRAIDSLETERIPQDSADQRAGRAGRLGPGHVFRLWHASDRLRPHGEPEIHRIDLSSPLLDVMAWGGDPRTLEWFEPPREGAIDAAYAVLEQLGAVRGGRLTEAGRAIRRLPVHPRLARILLSAAGARPVALACALLAERHTSGVRNATRATTSSDLLSAVERERDLPPHVLAVAAELQRLVGSSVRVLEEHHFRRAVFDGYPDRVAKRRGATPRLLLASGHGAVLASESGVRDAEFVVALDVTAGRRGEGSEALIRIASAVDREWLRPTRTSVEHELDESRAVARAFAREYYGAILLSERAVDPDDDVAAGLIARAYLARDPPEQDARLLARLRFAGLETDVTALVERAAAGCRRVRDLDLGAHLPWEIRRELDRLAPESLAVPSGRHVPLEYRDDGSVVASAKLQELFGLAETPRVGPRHEPVLLSLLAPNGRPVQLTRDLRSFWERTYPEVRKELRGRYPKHPWPEDPWTATPTRGVRRPHRADD